MKNQNLKITSTIVLALLLAGFFQTIGFFGTGTSGSQSQPRTITQVTPAPLNLQVHLVADGASFPLLLIQRYVNGYQVAHPNVTISYTATGSGQGQRDFINKTQDFAASDAPLNAGQRILAPNALHIPETIGAVTAAYNLKDSNGVQIPTGALNLNGTIIAKIYLGTITNWNDPMIQALNPTISLPNQPITVVERQDSSGTTFVWTSYLSQESTTWRTTPGLGPSTGGTTYPWPVGVQAQLNSGVAGKINSTVYSFGYVELAYVIVNHMTVANVKNPAGNYIFPTEQTTQNAVADGSGSLPAGNGDWSGVNLLNELGANDYPIVSFTYFFAYQELNVVPSMDLVDNVQAAVLKDFLNYCITQSGLGLGTDLGFPALPSSVISLDQATISSITFTHVSTPVPRTVNMSVGSTGWSPASLTVTSGDTINFNLLSTDGLSHQWYIDFNNNGVMDANEAWPGTQASPAFSSSTTPTPFQFTPVIWNQEGIPAAGTYTFRDANNAALAGTIIVQPQQVAAPLLPKSTLTNKFLPVLDTSRVSTIGSLVLDQRAKTASGLIAAVAVDKSSGTVTAQKTYNIPGLRLVRSTTSATDLTVSFVLNLAVLNGTIPQALSTDVTVTLHNDFTGSVSTLLTRELDMASQGTVNVVDLATVAIHYGNSVGQANYDPSSDVDANGVINVIDLATVAIYFGDQAFR